MRVRAPIVVAPATLTCEISFTPSPSARLRPDMAERADHDAGAEPRAGLDDGARMDELGDVDVICSPASPTLRPRSTSTPSTFASPRNHHMLRRLAMRVMWKRT